MTTKVTDPATVAALCSVTAALALIAGLLLHYAGHVITSAAVVTFTFVVLVVRDVLTDVAWWPLVWTAMGMASAVQLGRALNAPPPGDKTSDQCWHCGADLRAGKGASR
ncbi:hypothetical protein [Actinomadura miaoliensis]|uniref:Uncharacterized protein n=1 Tax=Actinomadura miaoliensis TaxID=430685 RepID=A0ABP7V4U1_9ACTN